MRPGSVMLQLFPYGWQLDSGEIIRTGLSRDIPLGLNGSYFQVCCATCCVCSSSEGIRVSCKRPQAAGLLGGDHQDRAVTRHPETSPSA